MNPILAVTVGDPNGVGPEVVLKAVRDRRVRRACIPLLVGAESTFAFYARRLGIPFRPAPTRTAAHAEIVSAWKRGLVPCMSLPEPPIAQPEPGLELATGGIVAAHAIALATTLVRRNLAQGIVTAPISKKALHGAGIHFPGQTEMLQFLVGAREVAMMLVCDRLRVGLVTIHIPLEQVPGALTARLVREKVMLVHGALRRDWGIRSPRIAVLALNPHAGEQGEIGTEEQTILIPALRALRRSGIRLDGPHPADAFFARFRPGAYDAVVAMYHDQGLIPLKLLAQGRGVNVSVGMPVVRTSPDHGTAFDIAGRGVADASSMIEALLLAGTIIRHRRARR